MVYTGRRGVSNAHQTVATNRYSILSGATTNCATPLCMLRDDAFAMKERFLDQSWTPPTEAVPDGAGG